MRRIAPVLATTAVLLSVLVPWTAAAAPQGMSAPGPAPSVAAHGASGAASPGDAVSIQLKQMVFNAQDKLGTLEPWQTKIFDEEVLPNPQRFIRDYRQSNQGVTGEVDVDSIRRFLKLYGPKLGTDPAPKLLVYLHADPSCAKCTAVLPMIQAMVKERLDRRVFVGIPITVEEVGDPKLSGKALDDRLTDLAQQKGAVGALSLLWQLAPMDDVDSAHADEIRYDVNVSLTIKGVGHNDDQLEILDSDSFELTANQLLTNSMTDMGEKVEEAQERQQIEKQGEILVTVSGFGDFAQYSRVKGELAKRLKDLAFDEREIGRGRAVFGVRTQMTRDQLKAKLASPAGPLEPNIVVEVQ